jgi:predicted dehydrogenase
VNPDTLNIGVIGLGFMGCTHVRAYKSATAAGLPCALIAVADRSAERLSGRIATIGNLGSTSTEQLFDPSRVRGYVDPRELLTDPNIHAVSICTYTDTHVDLGVAALRAGKHVLVEKPVALSSAEVARLAAAAKDSGKLCMPGMVMRFWPEWSWLAAAVRANTYGKVLSASFQRLGTRPDWTDFYRDNARTGGALWDLHIHDSDFIRFCFGEPTAVASTGTIDHLTTLYTIPSGPPHIVAQGGTNLSPGFGFRMRYTVVFEKATADFDLMRPAPLPPLLLHHDGRTDPIGPDIFGTASAYDLEIRAFINAISSATFDKSLPATIDDAVRTARLIEAEMASLSSGSALCRPRPSA